MWFCRVGTGQVPGKYRTAIWEVAGRPMGERRKKQAVSGKSPDDCGHVSPITTVAQTVQRASISRGIPLSLGALFASFFFFVSAKKKKQKESRPQANGSAGLGEGQTLLRRILTQLCSTACATPCRSPGGL
jgi:hypothetical protein